MSITITETEKSTFASSDLALVTTLSLYFPIERIERQNPRKAQFIFIRTPQLDDLIEKFWQKKLLIEPARYFDNLKSIKNRLYSNE